MKRTIIAGFVGMLVGGLATYLLNGGAAPFQASSPDAQYQVLGNKIDRLEALLREQRDTIAAYNPPSLMTGQTTLQARPDASPLPDSASVLKEEEAQVAKMLADIQAKSYDPSATFRETMTSNAWAQSSPSVQQRVIDEVMSKANSGEIPIGFIFPAARKAKQQ